jgi:hypothetical protein
VHFRVAVVLVAVVMLGAAIFVFAQGHERARTAQTDPVFMPLEYERSGSVERAGLYVAEIRMANGVTCYALTVRASPVSLDSIGQVSGLGCVR